MINKETLESMLKLVENYCSGNDQVIVLSRPPPILNNASIRIKPLPNTIEIVPLHSHKHNDGLSLRFWYDDQIYRMMYLPHYIEDTILSADVHIDEWDTTGTINSYVGIAFQRKLSSNEQLMVHIVFHHLPDEVVTYETLLACMTTAQKESVLKILRHKIAHDVRISYTSEFAQKIIENIIAQQGEGNGKTVPASVS